MPGSIGRQTGEYSDPAHFTSGKTHLRVDRPVGHQVLDQREILWALNEDLARAMSSSLSMISACLGVCESLAAETSDDAIQSTVMEALAIANAELERASNVARSIRELNELQLSGETQRSIGHAIECAVNLMQPEFRSRGITVQMKREPISRMLHRSPQLTKTLVKLLSILTSERQGQPARPKTLVVSTVIRFDQAVIRLSLHGNEQDTSCDDEANDPSSIQSRELEHALSTVVAKELGCDVRFERKGSGHREFSVVIDVEHALSNNREQ